MNISNTPINPQENNMSDTIEKKELVKQYKRKYYEKNKARYLENAKRRMEKINADEELKAQHIEQQKEFYKKYATQLKQQKTITQRQETIKQITKSLLQLSEENAEQKSEILKFINILGQIKF